MKAKDFSDIFEENHTAFRKRHMKMSNGLQMNENLLNTEQGHFFKNKFFFEYTHLDWDMKIAIFKI